MKLSLDHRRPSGPRTRCDLRCDKVLDGRASILRRQTSFLPPKHENTGDRQQHSIHSHCTLVAKFCDVARLLLFSACFDILYSSLYHVEFQRVTLLHHPTPPPYSTTVLHVPTITIAKQTQSIRGSISIAWSSWRAPFSMSAHLVNCSTIWSSSHLQGTSISV